MSRLTIEGGQRLEGTVSAIGAKNAVLPILAAAIMLDGETTIRNVPYLMDVNSMIRMLNALGIRAEYHHHDAVRIWNTRKIRHIAPYDLVTAMRASFFVAGPILAKTGYAKVPLPGGCSIGSRPVDIHLKGFEALGAKVSIEHGFVDLQAKELIGTVIPLPFPSVGATENLMMAACLAKGTTVIENAAREPEIEDLARFLTAGGAQISGAGTARIEIQGVGSLKGIESYDVIPDRVEVVTLLIAGGITGGDVTVEKARPAHIKGALELLHSCGFEIQTTEESIRMKSSGRIKPVRFSTLPYPGFPTDMQAQVMAMLTVADGVSHIQESIFENRFMHAQELVRMGADINISGRDAEVTGVSTLSGADVKITDLRAGAALILAGLVAKGHTTVYGLKHLKRGYDNLPSKLKSLGAIILE